jgi:hypothetical protein
MEAALGIANVKKALALIASLANLGDNVGRDTSPGRWTKLLALIGSVKDFAGINLSQVLPEIKDLTPAEKQELVAEIKEDLDLADDKLEAAIEEGLAIIIDLENVIERSSALVKAFKA